ncbi:diadenosine tetraphosphate (Ap4A) HIT family hydrolase [Natronospira proteinivora]|uniref:Diadenosine tetraphosphate (Ap4A) HIT family hydrolase n=1 Tax=Natronospira proteinivora TaxID=1807133 RepID=A0ABT1G9F3_9GAMM|nr:hypothetical protein [Natronospira proteinivora]MCP1727876.1 diadenosine tetraphosphate (Ap4A) HIT family hydrolase [Natronospira proteinivora]
MNADNPLTAFRENFQLDQLTVHESEHWILSVRPEQMTLGSMVLSSRSGRLHFSELSAEESADMGRELAVAERLAKEALGAVRINAVCLMMKDPIVHFHVLPRFDRSVSRYGVEWEDAFWPGPPTFGPAPTEEQTLLSLQQDLSSAAERLK